MSGRGRRQSKPARCNACESCRHPVSYVRSTPDPWSALLRHDGPAGCHAWDTRRGSRDRRQAPRVERRQSYVPGRNPARRRSLRSGRRYTDPGHGAGQAPGPEGNSRCLWANLTGVVQGPALPAGLRLAAGDGPITHYWRPGGSLAADERRRPRVAGLQLTEQERIQVRAADRTRAKCSTGWTEARRVAVHSGHAWEQRMLMRLGCGHRTCKRCQSRALRERADRLLGDWTTMVTLTYGRELRSCRDAWRRATSDAQWLCRTLSRAHKRAYGRACHYAWVLEEHQDGWPHIHVVGSWDCDLLDDHTLRMVWTERAGRDCWVVDWRPTDDPNAVRSYLSKYLAKGALRSDVAAVLGKRRIFGRSRDDRPVLNPPVEESWDMLRLVDHQYVVEAFARAKMPSASAWAWGRLSDPSSESLTRERRITGCAFLRYGEERVQVGASAGLGIDDGTWLAFLELGRWVAWKGWARRTSVLQALGVRDGPAGRVPDSGAPRSVRNSDADEGVQHDAGLDVAVSSSAAG